MKTSANINVKFSITFDLIRCAISSMRRHVCRNAKEGLLVLIKINDNQFSITSQYRHE